MSKQIVNPDAQPDSNLQPDMPAALTQAPSGYADWLAELKTRIHTAQQRAALAVNRELVLLYWQIGRDILERQAQQGWGAKVIERLAHDLRTSFPDMKGFSRANLMYMRAFADAWPDAAIVQQAVGQLPWGHNLVLLTKLKNPQMRMEYAQRAIQHGWSRNVLNIHIETRLLEREGKAVTNFTEQLPAPQSDLARNTLKDPYLFDFLGVGKEADEREIESAIVQHITRFLLELGAGFAYVGQQVHIEVGGDDFFIDLLFYHLKLRCYVVGVLSESNNPNRYWSDQKRKLSLEAGSEQPYEKIVRLKLTAPDGKQRDTNCANTEGLFRIIQSIPSPKAEPFKLWLAQVGYERVKEIENPELASAPAPAAAARNTRNVV